MRARLDQHFLVCEQTADRIVAATGIRPGERILEVGPGRGVLTRRLLKAGAEVTAVEIDEGLCEGLRGRFAGDAISVVHADWLELDLSTLPSPVGVVSNLPYSVGTPILRRLLDWPGWTSAVLMLQKEVAERVLAVPGGPDYGILSLAVWLKAEGDPLFDVPPECFSPPPKVQSAVLRLRRLTRSRLPDHLPEERFFRVVKAAFSQRRKLAAKSVAAGLGLARESVDSAFSDAGIPLFSRPQDIPPESYLHLANLL